MSALASIIVIDLILAGDNAIVIGLAARNVPPAMQRRVILWGTAGAIIVRGLLTAVVVWLLKIPGFLLVGGIALVYIGWKLTRGGDPGHAKVAARNSVRGAVQTIIVADAVMGVDNVLAVGGAAHGSFALVAIGLAVSIPIVVWGSTLVLKWVERYPAILWLGAGVLGFTAAKMIASEPLLAATIAGEATPAPAALRRHRRRPRGCTAVPRVALRPIACRPRRCWCSRPGSPAWGWLDERLAAGLDPAGAWQWDESLVDFVRWVGWIPVLIAIAARPGALRAESPRRPLTIRRLTVVIGGRRSTSEDRQAPGGAPPRNRARGRPCAGPPDQWTSLGSGFFGCLGFFGSLRCLSRFPIVASSSVASANSADYAPALQAVASACAKSAIRSARSSMPTDTRISESAMPISARRAGPISQKIVCATGIASVRLSPRFDDSTTMRRRLSTSKHVAAVDELEREQRAGARGTAPSRAPCCGCAASPG